MQAAAARKSAGRAIPPARAVDPRHIPAAVANPRLAIEIAFGATPARANARAKPCAHTRCRVFSGRRGGVPAETI